MAPRRRRATRDRFHHARQPTPPSTPTPVGAGDPLTTLITTVRAGTTTASIPEPAQVTAHNQALAVTATARITTDRHRHRHHKIKTRQPFPHAPRGTTTRTAPAHVHVCGTAA